MVRRLFFWLPYVYFHQLLCIPIGDECYKTIIIYNAFKTYLMLTPFFVSLWIWLRSKASCDYQERFLLQYHMSQGYNDLVLSIVQYIHLGYTIHLHSCLISNLAKKVSKRERYAHSFEKIHKTGIGLWFTFNCMKTKITV